MAENKQQIGAFWQRKGKKGNAYLQGEINGEYHTGFYVTKKSNPKEPDARFFKQIGNELEKDATLSLWCNVSAKGTKYLTGNLKGKRVVAFINSEATPQNNQPKLRLYYSDEPQPKEEAKQPKEESKPQQPTLNIALDDLPF